MNYSDIQKLIQTYKSLSKEVIDLKKYTYYTVTYHSTTIEGSTLTESQVINLMEHGQTAPKKLYEHHLMVSDHFKALEYVIKKASWKARVNTNFIQEINHQVMKNTGGEINSIAGSFDTSNGDLRLCTVRAGVRTFPDYKKVPKLLNDLCADVDLMITKATTLKQILELSFEAHFRLVSIHPFGDGNGRTSRLLMNYIQLYHNVPLSIVFKSDKLDYIKALEQARKEDDIKPFIAFMTSQYVKFLKSEIKNLNKIIAK